MKVLHLDKDNLAIRMDIILVVQIVPCDNGKYKVIIHTTQGAHATIFDTKEEAHECFDYVLGMMRSL